MLCLSPRQSVWLASVVSSASRVFTSDSRNRRWPPGGRVEPIRPAVAQRVTVLGSTRKRAATSPGVSSRSLTWPTVAVTSASFAFYGSRRRAHRGFSGLPVASWHLDHRVLERPTDGKEVV